MTPQTQLGQAISTHLPTVARDPEPPRNLSRLPGFPPHPGIWRPLVSDKPQELLFICQTMPIMGANISHRGPSSRNLQLDVIGLQGDRAETSKRARKINPKCPRVESSVIGRHLCASVNLSLSPGWLGSFQSPVQSVRGRPGRKPVALPLCPDVGHDDVSSLAGYKELGPGVTPHDPPGISFSSP